MILVIFGTPPRGDDSTSVFVKSIISEFNKGIISGLNNGNQSSDFSTLDEVKKLNQWLEKCLDNSKNLLENSDLSAKENEEFLNKAAQVVSNISEPSVWWIRSLLDTTIFAYWHSLLKETIFLFLDSNPVAYANALYADETLPHDIGIALWEQYCVTSLNAVHGKHCHYIPRDQFDLAADTITNLIIHSPKNSINSLEFDQKLVDLHNKKNLVDSLPDYLNQRQLDLYHSLTGNITANMDYPLTISAGGRQALRRHEFETHKKRSKIEEEKSSDLIAKGGHQANAIEQYEPHAHDLFQELQNLCLAVLDSNRWKLGSALLSIKQKLVPGNPAPDISQHINDIGRKYDLWSRVSSRNSKLKITVIAWDIGHNPLGRAYILAEALQRQFNVELVGISHNRYGEGLWEPLINTRVPIRYINADSANYRNDISSMQSLAASIDGDILYICKPRMPSIMLGLFAKFYQNRPAILDIDDYELSFFQNRTPISLKEVTSANGHSKYCLHDEIWTRYAQSLVSKFDGITVSNKVLQDKFGGTLIPHVRDERLFNPDKVEERKKIRREFGYEEDDKVILFIGTPRLHKGIGDILGALDELKNDRYKLCVIGSPADKKTSDRLNTANKKILQLIPNTSFLSLHRYLLIGDLLCVLQDIESEISNFQMPAKISDALAMGIPILAYNVPPLELLHKRGLLHFVKKDNLANKIDDVFKEYSRYKKIAEKNRTIFKQEYSYGAGCESLAICLRHAAERFRALDPEFLALKKHFEKYSNLNKENPNQIIEIQAEDQKPKPKSSNSLNLVMFWKQNDTTLYGRRQEMLLKYLARNNKVSSIIHFDYPIRNSDMLRFMEELENDSTSEKGLVYKQTISRLNGRDDGDKITSYTYSYSGKLKANQYINYVESALRKHGLLDEDLVFITYPRDYYVPAVIEHFNPKVVVADIIDDHRAWPGQPQNIREQLTKNYQTILHRADVAFTNCNEVYNKMTEFMDNIHVVENACELFQGEPLSWPIPAELSDSTSPIIGYVGNLDDRRIDIPLVQGLAKAYPDWRILFIGSTHNGPEVRQLGQQYSNIQLLGVKTYQEALKYINAFDLAIIPHKHNDLTANMNPLKAYVYASLNVPILTTKIQNLDSLSDFMTIAESNQDFIAKVKTIIKTGRPNIDVETLNDKLRKHSWEDRVNTILSEIDKVLAET